MNKLHDFKPLSIVLLVAGMFLQACAPDGPPETLDSAHTEALVARVTDRWDSMAAKDFGAVYEFNTPNYRRTFSKSLYLNKFAYGVDWELTDVDVVNYDAQAAVASVVVRVMSESTKQTASSSMFGAVPTTVNENWFLIDGQWWHSVK